MSLIDVLKSDSHKLTPRLSLAAGLLYMISSDGEIKPEEITHLEIVLDGDNALIETALKYVKEVKFAQFLADRSEEHTSELQSH